MPAWTCIAALALLVPGAAAKSYRAETYTSEIEIHPDGDLRVTEAFEFRFEGGPFTYAYRTLPLRDVDGIEIESSSEPFEMRRGERVEVTWRFAACRDTLRRMALAYRVHGALRLEAGKRVLHWVAFPSERRYAIERTQMRVTWPADWPDPVSAGARPASADVAREPRALVFTAGRLGRDRNVRVHIGFDAAALGAVPIPAWQARRLRWEKRWPLLLAGGAAVLLLGIGLVLARYREAAAHAGRPPAMPRSTAPPSDLSPTLAGALRKGGADLSHALACCTDLAARGYVEFVTQEARHWWGGGKYLARRLRPAHELARWERVVMESAFHDGDSVPLARAWQGICKNLKSFKVAVRDELLRRGDLDPGVGETRRHLAAVAGVWGLMGVAGFAVLPFVWAETGPAGLIPCFAFLLVGVAALVAAGAVPRHSAQGAERARAWRSFARHLDRLARQKPPLDARQYQEWLPYALALGVAPAWLQAGKRWHIEVPEWFRTLPGDLDSMGSLAAMYAITASGGVAGAGGSARGAGGAAGGGGSGAG
jgi:hypothetical protein